MRSSVPSSEISQQSSLRDCDCSRLLKIGLFQTLKIIKWARPSFTSNCFLCTARCAEKVWFLISVCFDSIHYATAPSLFICIEPDAKRTLNSAVVVSFSMRNPGRLSDICDTTHSLPLYSKTLRVNYDCSFCVLQMQSIALWQQKAVKATFFWSVMGFFFLAPYETLISQSGFRHLDKMALNIVQYLLNTLICNIKST